MDMEQLVVRCPGCGKEFAVEEGLLRGLEEKLLGKFREQMNEETERKIRNAEQRIRNEVRDETDEQMREQLAEIERLRKKNQEMADREIALMQKARELEEREQQFNLEMQRRLEQERQAISKDTEERVRGNYELKLKEMEETIRRQTEKIQELSSQTQVPSELSGEVQEQLLENELRATFPSDVIVPVSRGVRGADVLQYVRTQGGRECGLIIWESKRAKTWREEWVAKLKEDQREKKADVAVLLTEVVPEGMKHVGAYNEVFITDRRNMLGVCQMLRYHIIRLSEANNSNMRRAEKESMLYSFILSNEFRQGVQAIAEAIASAKKTLEEEKKALNRIWGRREQELMRSMEELAALYGRMQGIVGSLPSIGQFELPEE